MITALLLFIKTGWYIKYQMGCCLLLNQSIILISFTKTCQHVSLFEYADISQPSCGNMLKNDIKYKVFSV